MKWLVAQWLKVWSLFLIGALLLPASCGSNPTATDTTTPPETKRLIVVTTMSILNDMVKQVGGERVESQNIIPIGAGPEDYQPTPEAAQAIAAADLIFYNGYGLEEWLDDLFESAARPGQHQIAVAEGLPALDVGGEEFAQGNPHFWLSAAYAAKYVERIRDGLIRSDAANTAFYTSNADAYIKQLLDLNTELKQMAEMLPQERRKIVTNHDAFPYFAEEYGFTIVGNILGNPESEPSAGDMARLVQRIKQEQVKAIFSESQFNPRLSKILADEAGITVVANLYTDTLGEEGSEVATYIAMMRYNMKTIVEALK